MTIGRPELAGTIAAASGSSLSHSNAEALTRYLMEAAILDRIKGRKSADRGSYKPKDGSAVLIGSASKRLSEGPETFKKLSILEATEASGGIVLDPVGRLLPPLKVPTFDENKTSHIELHPFTSAVLGSISRLSPEEAAALPQTPEAKSACLELNVDTSTAVFRWSADGKEHWVRFKHPGGTLAEVLGKEPPAYQTVTKLYFPLLFAVGRLFAATPPRRSADPVPPSETSVTTAVPERETPEPHHRAPAPVRENRPHADAIRPTHSLEGTEVGSDVQSLSVPRARKLRFHPGFHPERKEHSASCLSPIPTRA